MKNKRGSMMLYVILGVILVLMALFLVYVLRASDEPPSASTTWEQPVNEYLRLCLQRATDESVDLTLKGGGYMLNESALIPGFGPAKLLYYNELIPVHYNEVSGKYSIVAVFDTDPGKVKLLPDAPCFTDTTEVGSSYDCEKREFFQDLANFPFGAGAVGEYQYRELPRLALYGQDPTFPYEPKCGLDHPCDHSVQEQLEIHLDAAMRTCVEQAKTNFYERGIDIEYLEEPAVDERVVSITIKDDGTTALLAPLSVKRDSEEKLVETVNYRNEERLKQLFTLAHGGSTDYVLGATGIIEAESRDPDFILARDGNDILKNVLFLDTEQYAIDIAPGAEDTASVTLSYNDGQSSLDFLMMNRKPFLNQVAPAEVTLSGRGFDFVPIDIDQDAPGLLPEVKISFDYSLFLDAKDPDDALAISAADLFRLKNDDVTILALDLMDDNNGHMWLDQIGSNFIYDAQSKRFAFRLVVSDGYAFTDDLMFIDENGEHHITPPDDPDTEDEDFLVAYINQFDVNAPLRITIEDSEGNIDYITLSAGASYEYGPTRPDSITLFTNTDAVPFDQAWPWLILPNVDRGPLEQLVYFFEEDDYQDRCTIDFSNLQAMNPDLIGSRFKPDKNLTHLDEYAPEIYQSIATIIQEDRGRSFGFDQCCPGRELMQKFKERGICAPELCCFQAPFLGHQIRFFEQGDYNTTNGWDGNPEDIACELETEYNQIGGDYYPQYLDTFFATNVIMAYRENLDIALSGAEPGDGGETPRAVVQVLPLRFKPDLYDVRVSEDYSGGMESYFQSFAAMNQLNEGTGEWWEFAWDDEAWLVDGSVAEAAEELMSLMTANPGMFGEGWTWWDYREMVQECDDGWTSRESLTGDCVPDQLAAIMEETHEYELNLLDPFICNDSDFTVIDGALPSIAGFASEMDRCPNMLETMRNIYSHNNGTNNSCTREECCFTPPYNRGFWYMSGFDPAVLEQYQSWVPEYDILGSALVIEPVGARPAFCESCAVQELCTPAEVANGDCPGELISYLNTADPNGQYQSGGPFRSIAARTRIQNFQWTDRVLHNSGMVNKRSGDTMMPGQGQIEYGSDVGEACSSMKILHRCAYGEGMGYDASSFVDAGIDPAMIGVKPDGSRSCPDHLESYALMINGTCRIQDCCLEIGPKGFQTSVGRPGGGALGEYSEPCPLIPAAPPEIEDPVNTTNPPPGPTYPDETYGGGMSI